VAAVGLGDRLRLSYPVLMLLIAVALTFIPGFPVFRVRWQTLLLMAVALVVVLTAVVAGATWLMIPGIGIPAAIALGAMVLPPDLVAV
jgi:CPA1 family monovalent cation:H+ antiporter